MYRQRPPWPTLTDWAFCPIVMKFDTGVLYKTLPSKREFRNLANASYFTDRPLGLQKVQAPRFVDNRDMKVVGLSALRTGRLYPPGNIPGTHFCQRLSQPQGNSAIERIMSMKNSSDTIGIRTRDLQACSAVPQPTAPPRNLKDINNFLEVPSTFLNRYGLNSV
jgi:hypothetical protein